MSNRCDLGHPWTGTANSRRDPSQRSSNLSGTGTTDGGTRATERVFDRPPPALSALPVPAPIRMRSAEPPAAQVRARVLGGPAGPLLCGLLALAACLWRVDGPVLWRDEIATWTVSRRDLPELVAVLGNVDASTGAYYVVMHGWTAVFGDSATAMRMPAVLAMAGAAACVAAHGRREFGPRAGLAAGIVFASLPSVSRYGQEARGYGFVCLTAATAVLLLARALERPGLRRWAAYAVSVAFLGLWHLVALAAVAGHVGYLLLRRREAWRGFAVAVVAGLAPLAPLFALAATQRVRQIEWIPRPELDSLQSLLPRLAASGPVAVGLAVLAIGAWTARPARGPVLPTAIFEPAFPRPRAKPGASPTARPGSRPVLAAVTATAVAPVAVVWAASLVGDTSFFLPRYLLFTLPAWAVLAGAGLGLLAQRLTPAVAAAVLVALVAAGVPDHRALRASGAHEQRDHPEPSDISWVDYAGVADIVRAGQRPGDGIVYSSIDQRLWHVDAGVEYYLRGDPVPRDVLAGRTGEDRDDLWTHDCLDPAACLDAVGAERIWLVAVVLRGAPADPYAAMPRDKALALRDRYHVVRSVAVAGAYVSLLERGATPSGGTADACAEGGQSPYRRWVFGDESRCAAGTGRAARTEPTGGGPGGRHG
ncbi:MAG TPA: glycosyltransferase family 39 protein [Yinghuangia sp.]|uniref:glycosyltransferase family 39 protein n=1 Tax=Yinghuangia sp. YIM S10712 TaxID=3436930 RepID=UPI002CE0DD17|nr:glycosyltransferase family 39 protein [Yinghuangia sp.]